jgi:ArsR family metal-binding transcriptional regulator
MLFRDNSFTPPPWLPAVNSSSGKDCVELIGLDRGFTIATIHGTGAEAEANARLIAAAPELLAALQNILNHAEIAGKTPEQREHNRLSIVSMAQSAISKATTTR